MAATFGKMPSSSEKSELTDEFETLHQGLYPESDSYDCSFRVGKGDDTQIFRCHKLVLAAKSEAFAKMLMGYYRKGHLGRDEPIAFDDCNPITFDLAMRFVYNNVQEFSTVPLACDVCKFAHKWLFPELKQAALNAVRKTKTDADALMVYEMHTLLFERERKQCKKFIVDNTEAVLNSDSWIKAQQSTIVEICKEPVLSLSSEKQLFDALVLWGKANSDSDSNLRLKIDSALKEIRFLTMSVKGFTELCKSNPEILSGDEKFLILSCIANDDPIDMPPGFNKLEKERKPIYPLKYCYNPYSNMREGGFKANRKMNFSFKY
ncbi:Hypothetical predicted protein [Cloeon dipterum]|uniref:BTB domain-containing protein n=3 Tax=Cloeon dipterum TaxID=197152 RepID=A0A8S1E3C3_9INSE|nr:Hypothetical predicted protein [Cloeon dipterum]